MKYLLLLLPFLLISCDRPISVRVSETSASPTPTPNSHHQVPVPVESFGWMDKNCIAIKNGELHPPVDIKIARLDGSGATEKATITGTAISSETCPALLEDRKAVNTNAGYSFYAVETTAPVDLAVGLLTESEATGQSFSYCSTSEGISFKVEKERIQIWSGYYYLGYDTEDTCHETSK